MAVVEKDQMIHGMLKDEQERCERLMAALEAAIAELPRGSLHQRKVKYKDKDFTYHYLKFRDGQKSVYKHVSRSEVPVLEEKIKVRRKKEQDLKQLKARVKYLNKIL